MKVWRVRPPKSEKLIKLNFIPCPRGMGSPKMIKKTARSADCLLFLVQKGHFWSISSKFSIYLYFLDYNIKTIILITFKTMSFKSKILIIYSHTGYSGKFTNKTIINALKSLDNVIINELDSNPEGLKFDILKE